MLKIFSRTISTTNTAKARKFSSAKAREYSWKHMFRSTKTTRCLLKKKSRIYYPNAWNHLSSRLFQSDGAGFSHSRKEKRDIFSCWRCLFLVLDHILNVVFFIFSVFQSLLQMSVNVHHDIIPLLPWIFRKDHTLPFAYQSVPVPTQFSASLIHKSVHYCLIAVIFVLLISLRCLQLFLLSVCNSTKCTHGTNLYNNPAHCDRRAANDCRIYGSMFSKWWSVRLRFRIHLLQFVSTWSCQPLFFKQFPHAW